ncbi:MAG: SufD family Fe-S cluster assembly protein [Bacteroidales bacterium]|nr:SufD family Fe-S cluster assembly protein [Bacteroidales bacterium]
MTNFRTYFVGRDVVPETIVLGRDEELSVLLIALPGVSADVSLKVDLNGEGARFALNGVGISTADEKIRVHVELRHNVPGCSSSQLFKNLVGGMARVDFYGRIIVAQDAQKTEAYQANHNLLLSETARVNTKPQLEIYADDVKCSHGATIGKLNEDEQFYMRSRGISLAEARFLQMISFVSPVFELVPEETERERLRDEVEAELRTIRL